MDPPLTQESSAGDKPLVLLADPIIPEFQPELDARFRLLPLAAAAKASARALLTIDLPAVSSDVIAMLPALELVVASSVGVDHVDLAACRRRGIRVTNAGAAYSADAADYAVGLVVAVLRRVAAADAYVRCGGWADHGDYPLATKVSVVEVFFFATLNQRFPLLDIQSRSHSTGRHGTRDAITYSHSLMPAFPRSMISVVTKVTSNISFCFFQVSGKRVGIVGLGRIGSLVARRLSALGCPVSYHSRSRKPSSSAPYKFYSTVRELAADSDVLVLCCALTEQTHHMINRDVIQALGSRGILVNVGRGGLVDEPELVRCLGDGVIAGAGLDVYENEPDVPPELFGMDNVVLSNHRAVLTPESMQGVLDLVVGNLEAFFAGKPLLSPVAL